MSTSPLSRRSFLGATATYTAAALARLSWPAALAAAQAACSARDEGKAFTTLSAAEARDIEAFTARILPTTDTPGAREAGVVWFFDTVLGDDFADMLPGLRGALEGFTAGIGERFAGAARFADLDDAEQDAWIATHEDSPFFGMARMLTLTGFFAMSRYGGNRDGIGWRLIGFEPHGAAVAPFGYYDARYLEDHDDGA